MLLVYGASMQCQDIHAGFFVTIGCRLPDHLLQARYMVAEDGQADFEDDIVTLRAYSLIGLGVSEHLFDMYRLVQLSTHKWLEIHEELRHWEEQHIDILGAASPGGATRIGQRARHCSHMSKLWKLIG
jgi:hypothetical protein